MYSLESYLAFSCWRSSRTRQSQYIHWCIPSLVWNDLKEMEHLLLYQCWSLSPSWLHLLCLDFRTMMSVSLFACRLHWCRSCEMLYYQSQVDSRGRWFDRGFRCVDGVFTGMMLNVWQRRGCGNIMCKKYRFKICENWCYFMIPVNSNAKISSTLRGQFGVGLDVNERSRYLVSSKSTPALGVSSLLFCYF